MAMKQIPTSDLKKLAQLAASSKSRVSAINGELGSAIKEATELKNLHPRSFRKIVKFMFMDELTRKTEKDADDYYYDVFDKNGWFQGGHVGDLDKMAKAKSASESEEELEAEGATEEKTSPLDTGWEDEDPDKKAAAANGEALAAGIGKLEPPDPNAKKNGGGRKRAPAGEPEVNAAADRAQRRSAEKAAQLAQQKVIDEAARKGGSNVEVGDFSGVKH